MAIQGQVVQPKPVCQKDDNAVQERQGGKIVPPESWKLSKQQQEFIDLFSTDDHKKQ
ncbi:hypothetical protein [Dryocola sp. BD626]|jgi:hypothetical protein|uniref:hypothetical protein n=1 Tax=Dryocola sp. BD626 TaxID=3133273 RepID=UPI003F4F5F2A